LYPSTPRHWTNLSWHCPAYIASKGVVSAGIAGVAADLWTSYAYNGTGIFDGPWDSDKFQLGLGTRPRYAKSEPEVLVPSAMYTVADARTIEGRPGIFGYFTMRPYVLLPHHETGPLHGQGYNILFGDGHVALVKRNDYLFPPRTAHNWNRDNQPHPEAWAPAAYWAVHH
jgi:prepilin-type processing-associated H-X9-DG protein